MTHYVDVFNYAASTGDVEELSRLSSPDCQGCQSYIKLYEDTYAAGGYFRKKSWALSSIRIQSEGENWLVVGDARAGPGVLRLSAGDKERVGESIDTSIGFRIGRNASPQLVAEMGLGS